MLLTGRKEVSKEIIKPWAFDFPCIKMETGDQSVARIACCAERAQLARGQGKPFPLSPCVTGWSIVESP